MIESPCKGPRVNSQHSDGSFTVVCRPRHRESNALFPALQALHACDTFTYMQILHSYTLSKNKQIWKETVTLEAKWQLEGTCHSLLF